MSEHTYDLEHALDKADYEGRNDVSQQALDAFLVDQINIECELIYQFNKGLA